MDESISWRRTRPIQQDFQFSHRSATTADKKETSGNYDWDSEDSSHDLSKLDPSYKTIVPNKGLSINNVAKAQQHKTVIPKKSQTGLEASRYGRPAYDNGTTPSDSSVADVFDARNQHFEGGVDNSSIRGQNESRDYHDRVMDNYPQHSSTILQYHGQRMYDRHRVFGTHPARPLPTPPFVMIKPTTLSKSVPPRAIDTQAQASRASLETVYSDNDQGTPPPFRFWEDHKNLNTQPKVVPFPYSNLPDPELPSAKLHRLLDAENGNHNIAQWPKEEEKPYTPVKQFRKRPVPSKLPKSKSPNGKDPKQNTNHRNLNLKLPGKYETRTIASMSTLTDPCARSTITEPYFLSPHSKFRDSQSGFDSTLDEDVYPTSDHEKLPSTDAAKYSGKYASVATFIEPFCPDISSHSVDPSSSDATFEELYVRDGKSTYEEPSSSYATTFEETNIVDANWSHDRPPRTPVKMRKGRESRASSTLTSFANSPSYEVPSPPPKVHIKDDFNVSTGPGNCVKSIPHRHSPIVAWSPPAASEPLPPPPPKDSQITQKLQVVRQEPEVAFPEVFLELHAEEDPDTVQEHQFQADSGYLSEDVGLIQEHQSQPTSGPHAGVATDDNQNAHHYRFEPVRALRPDPAFFQGLFPYCVPPVRPVTPPQMPDHEAGFELISKCKEYSDIATRLTEDALKEGDASHFFKSLVRSAFKGATFLDALRKLNTTLGDLANLLELWPNFFGDVRQVQVASPYISVSI